MFQDIPVTVTFVLAAVVAWVAYFIYRLANEEIKIRRYGGHAPSMQKWWDPLGASFIYGLTSHSLRDETLEFFHDQFCLSSHGRKRPYNYEVRLCGTRLIFTADPENVKAMLSTQFNDYGKGEKMRQDWHDLLGESILTADGQSWQKSRQIVRTYFTKQRISDLECFERHMQRLLPMLSEGGAVDVKDLLSRFALDASAEFTFGIDINSLHEPKTEFAKAFETIRATQALIERAGAFNFLVRRGEFRRQVKVAKDFIAHYVQEALALSPEDLQERDKKDKDYTFLHACLTSIRDSTRLIDEILTVVTAGRDTAAQTIALCLFELSRYPEYVIDMRREIEEHVGFDRPPTYAELRSLKLVHNALNETLRLYPSVPFNARTALRDTSLPRGGGPQGEDPIGVPEGGYVVWSTHVMHLSPELHPPESESFPPAHLWRPHRWDDWYPDNWSYLPFNAGPRICVGQQFAITEMSYVVVRILQQYSRIELKMREPQETPKTHKWVRRGDGPELAEKFAQRSPQMATEITMAPRFGIQLAFHE
ncbi:cytochrome P450 [Phyllosticta citribraziliensis]|uniref:Cytochrome P450 n=1 Tax=Phyllosticta citribraziliensis TaxID=989973 RepID=A0ABR1L7A5_9PEZI